MKKKKKKKTFRGWTHRGVISVVKRDEPRAAQSSARLILLTSTARLQSRTDHPPLPQERSFWELGDYLSTLLSQRNSVEI